MEVKTYGDPLAFREKVEPYLLQKEALNNLPLGILDQLTSYNNLYQEPPFLSYVEDEGEILCVVMRTPPHMLILAAIHDVPKQAIQWLVSNLCKERGTIPGVIGEVKIVEAFAEVWQKAVRARSFIHMKQRIFQLDRVHPVPISEGRLKLADESDYPLAVQWIYNFGQEVFDDMIMEEATNMAKRFIEQKTLRFWQLEDRSVSMINQSRSTKHGTTVNGVYTPDKYKGNGYATSAVATLSQQLLDDGYNFCSLYTDVANPTSNNIYKKIGYYPVGDSMVIHFNKSSISH